MKNNGLILILKKMGFNVLTVFVLFSMISCIPRHLQKYAKNRQEVTPSSSVGNEPKNSQPPRFNKRLKQNVNIYAVDARTFRFRLKEGQVWDSALSVLMRNYNINIVDRSSGVITTEWDSFYLDEKVLRNKISMFIKRLSWNSVDVIIYNNVELLQNSSQVGTSVWLPAQDDAKEIGRIVQNMAIYLREPVPALPQDMIAKSVEDDGIVREKM